MSFHLSNGDLGYDGIPVTLNYFAGLPDPSILSDANITILFKSLLKKDSITKEKSLNDMLETLTIEARSAGGLSPYAYDLTVILWIQLYPKLAIDNSRIVRILAHQVQAKFLELLGGKAFSKYFKSSIPIWLLGLFDNDRVVATATYKALLSSFQNDKDKIEKLWVLFYEQIVNFIVTVVMETPDSLSDKRYTKESDLYAKYERVFGGSLSMLNKLAQIPRESLKLGNLEVIVKEIEKLLNLEKLWDYLGSTLVSETLNLGLFKTILVLIKTLFNATGDFISQLRDPKGLFKLISKKFIKHVKFKASKPSTANSNIIYSNVVLQLWDTLSQVTEFTTFAIAKDFKIKKLFWELGGSKSETRLIEYLKLGHCNLDPDYYSTLAHFFEVLKKNEALQKPSAKGSEDSNSDSEASDLAYRNEAVLKALRQQFKSLTSFDFKEKASDNFLKIYLILEEDLNGSEPFEFVAYSALDLLARIRPRHTEIGRFQRLVSGLNSFIEVGISKHKTAATNILNSIDQYIKEGENSGYEKSLQVLGFKIESSPSSFFEIYFEVLTKTQSKLLEHTVPELSKHVEESLVEGEQPQNPAIAFRYFSIYLKNGPNVTDSSVSSIFELIPSFVEQDFLELPLELFRDFLNTPFSLPSDPEVKEVINDFYLKLTMVTSDLGWISKFLLAVSETRKLSQESYPDIYQHVLEISHQALSNIDSSLVYKFIDDPQILENLLESASLSENNSRAFVTNIANFGSGIDTNIIEQSLYVRLVLKNIWSAIEQPEVQQFLNSLLQELVEVNLFEEIATASLSTNFGPIATYFTARAFDSGALFSQLKPALLAIADSSLTLSNPIEHNIALVDLTQNSQSHVNVLVHSKFVFELIKVQPGEFNLILLSSYIAEYINDYLFLDSQTKDDEAIFALRSDLLTILRKVFDCVTLDQLVSKSDDLVGRIIVWLEDDMKKNTFSAFYSARVYKQIADVVFDSLTLQGFEDSAINFNQLVASPLQLSVFLLCGSKFFNKSTKFDRIRNYVAAEILGVKKEALILGDGLKWITLINNFFTSEESYEVIPPHRLAMVINQIGLWLDSDIAYDLEFIVLRVQLAKLFANLISSGVSLPDKIWELTIRLINDNLSTSQGEIDRLDLRYFTFKLVLSVLKVAKSQAIEAWNEGKESIYEEFVDIITNREMTIRDAKKSNQAVDLVHALSQRIFDGIEITSRLANDKMDRLYEVLKTGNFIPLQVIAVSLLEQVILKNQQDFVVEYQLQKSHLGDDPEKLYKAKLNETLIANILGEVDDMEVESLPLVGRFLWSWYLVFTHFEDTTISIRSEYISQLKEFGAINALFEYIFDQVDVGDPKLIQKLAGDSGEALFQTYTPGLGFSGESLEFEFRFLMLHLYYLSFRFLGTQVQTWYKEIRDRQLKQRVQKFSSKYVSPLLINKILREVSTTKSSLQQKDENLTIKVNWISNEIKSTYIIDEQTMEMVIKVPTVYPLENVTVNGPLRLGVKENQWKAWLLASQRVISLTNGSIMEAIELFNKNVNLHFSGFEECAICYSILHQDLSLPSKTCLTCSNKFHAACLYKWFKSSGSSTCPLCRSAFNFKATRESVRA